LLIEDLNPLGDVTSVIRSSTDVVELARSEGQKIIVTSYATPDRALREALDVSPVDALSVPDFSEEEIEHLLMARGAPTRDIGLLARSIFLHTSGHPTLVDVRAETLRAIGFPRPTADSVLETPGDVL